MLTTIISNMMYFVEDITFDHALGNLKKRWKYCDGFVKWIADAWIVDLIPPVQLNFPI